MSHTLRFLVIEYLPQLLHNRTPAPVRIDGHYKDRAVAEEVAELWRDEPMHAESRIVVAEVHVEVKAPAHWKRREPA